MRSSIKTVIVEVCRPTANVHIVQLQLTLRMYKDNLLINKLGFSRRARLQVPTVCFVPHGQPLLTPVAAERSMYLKSALYTRHHVCTFYHVFTSLDKDKQGEAVTVLYCGLHGDYR